MWSEILLKEGTPSRVRKAKSHKALKGPRTITPETVGQGLGSLRPAVALLGLCPRVMKACVHSNTCAHMLVAPWSVIPQTESTASVHPQVSG